MKERLTGAVILVVLVVALVPELLTGPKPAAAPRAATTADGAPIQSVIMNLSEPLPAGVETTSPSAGAPAAPAASSATGAPTPNPSSTRIPRPTPSPPAPPPPAPSGDNVATVSAPPATSQSPQAPVSAPTPTSAAGARGPVTPGTFVVQAGTFSNRANANRLARELSAKGLAAHVAMMQGAATPWFRVRVGPAGDRGTAMALLARVRTVVAGASLVSVSAPGATAP